MNQQAKRNRKTKKKKKGWEHDFETGRATETGQDSVADMATRYELNGPRF